MTRNLISLSSVTEAEAFQKYNSNYQKGINSVFNAVSPKDELYDKVQQLRLNVADFAAHKAYKLNKGIQDGDKIIKAKFNQYQKTEYNAVVARCRTVDQWDRFQGERHLYPNIEWLLTRSVTPREEHLAYVGLVLPMDDPFWQNNQPGNEWGCKCDWRTTDAEPTDAPADVRDPSEGLEGNPYETGEIFTDNHPYFKNIPDADERLIDKSVYKEFLKPQIKELTSTIDKYAGIELKAKNIKTGKLTLLRGSVNEIAEHNVDNQVRLYVINIKHNFKEWKYIGWSDVDKSKHSEAVYFFYYKTMINNKERYINVMVRKDYKAEVPYAIMESINLEPINKKGMPKDIEEYIKK